jgi:hypothetical protein
MEIKIGKTSVPAFIDDLSRTGISFYAEVNTGNAGDSIEFMIELPPEITRSTFLKVQCDAEIVRISRSFRNQVRIAAHIHHYRFVSAAGI